MPLPWVRLDTTFPGNPKLLALLAGKDGHRAAFAYVCSLAYAGAHGTDGFIPREALPWIHCRQCDAALLARAGFWEEQPGGWVVHDWEGFQESGEESQRRRKRAQAAAQARWNGHEAATAAERARRYRDRKRDRDGAGG